MPGCLAIKSNDKLCRNWAMKGKTCCYVHQYLEDVEPEQDYLPELLENLRFVLRNKGIFDRQERRVAMFAVRDKFADDPDKLYQQWTVRFTIPEIERYLWANGHGPIER